MTPRTPDAADLVDVAAVSADLATNPPGDDPVLPAPARSRVQVIDDVALLTRPRPPELIAGRIPAESFGVVFGPAGSCKTFLMLLLALCVALRRTWLGADVLTGGPVVYIAAEGGAGLGARVRAAKMALDAPLDKVAGLYIVPMAVNLMDGASITGLLAATADLHPALFVADTMARCMPGGDENSARDVGMLIAGCDLIRQQTGAAVQLIHHANKSGAAERGSSALRAACDTMLSLERVDDLLTLSCEKQKDSEPFEPIALCLVPVLETDSCTLRLASDVLASGSLTPTQVQLLVTLSTTFLADGPTTAEWLQALPKVAGRTFYRARKMLVDLGYVRPSGKRFVWTGKRFGREADDARD